MSFYQYYEFHTVDSTLSKEDMKALRSVSSRAEITDTSFINEYHFGDFKGNEMNFMKRWFDLHLHIASWGKRQLMIRVPKRLVERSALDPFLKGWGIFEVSDAGDNLILNFCYDEEDIEYYDDDWNSGPAQLGGMATLRSDILSGDWRALYLAWLWGVDNKYLIDEAKEPMPGIGPLNAPLKSFANFFRINIDLVSAAAERPANVFSDSDARSAAYAAIESMPDREKTNLLCRIVEGDPHAAVEVRRRVRDTISAGNSPVNRPLRTASELRERAIAVQEERLTAERKEHKAEQKRQEIAAEKARLRRIETVRNKGDSAWREIEDALKTRSGKSYDEAAQLLFDLKTVADDSGTTEEFFNRLLAIRRRHSKKIKFLERIENLRH